MILKWTKEKPTKSGWYWIRNKSDRLITPNSNWHEHIIIYFDTQTQNVFPNTKIHPELICIPLCAFYETEWAGPIQEPEEKC